LFEKAVGEEPLVHIMLTVIFLTISCALRPALTGLSRHKITPKTKMPPGENQSSLEALLSHPSFGGVSYLPPEGWGYVESLPED